MSFHSLIYKNSMLRDEQEIKAALNSLQTKKTDNISRDRFNHPIKYQKSFLLSVDLILLSVFSCYQDTHMWFFVSLSGL